MKEKAVFKKKNIVLIVFTAFSPVLLASHLATAQRRFDRNRYGEVEEAYLPEQRAPLEKSKLNLSRIPFRIVYESFRDAESGGNWEICLINADGSNPINLTNTPDVDEFYPHASPDGSKVCYVAVEGDTAENRSRNAYYMDIEGGRPVKIAENAYQPCWSADGQKIAYLKGEYSRYSSSSWSNRGIAIYDLKTKKTTQHPNQELGLLFNLCWSPDGNWFTATSRARGWSGSNIAFGAGNKTEMSLSIHGCRPDISPDGSQVAWGISDHVLMTGELDFSSSMDNVIAQTPVIACYESHKVYHVDWSPDGNYLAFSYGPARGDQAVGRKAPGWNICVYDFATGTWIQVTSDGQHNKEPDWVPVRF